MILSKESLQRIKRGKPINKLAIAIGRLLCGFFSLAAVFICSSGVGAQTLVIENVTLIDGTGTTPVPNIWVIVDGDRIVSVTSGAVSTPEGITHIDGTGKFLIPGLMDTHIHLAGGRQGMVTEGQRSLTMDLDRGVETVHGYLFSGVTTLYDSGNYSKFIFKMRDDERSGKIVSPRIFTTGSVVAFPGGYASGEGSTTVGNWDEVSKLDALLAMEPDMVKFVLDPQGAGASQLRPTFSPELLKRLILYCQERGFRTTIHVASEEHALQAVGAGVNALAHVIIRGVVSDSFAELMASRQIPMATTMTVFNNIARIAKEPEIFDSPLFVATLEPNELERQKTVERQRYISSGMSGMFSLMMPYLKENVRKLHMAGAVLAAGTDRTFGPTLHQELESLVESGVTPSDAIRIATLNGATYLGKEDDLGSIVSGKLADMVLLGADPTVDIRNAQVIEAVFKGGVQIDLGRLRLPINRS